MKIAFLTRNYGQPGGGSEAYINTLGRELIRLGNELHIWSDIDAHAGHPKSIVHTVAIPHGFSVLSVRAFAIRAPAALRRHERQHGPFDVVAGFGKVADCDVYRAGGGVHRRYVETKPWPNLQRRFNPLHRSMIAIEDQIYAADQPRAIICNSAMVQREIQAEYGLPDDRFTVIYNGVDVLRFSPVQRATHRPALRAQLGLVEDDLVCLFVGGGWERKGLDVLMRALALLAKQNARIPWRVVVVGRGKPEPYRAIAAQAGLSADEIAARLRFVGAQGDPMPYYAMADVVALPTRYDAGANVVQEGLAGGLPVITTSTNGTAELIDNTRGAVIDGTTLDPAELAAAMATFEDPARRDTAGLAARAMAETLRPVDNARKTIEIYERAMAAKKR